MNQILFETQPPSMAVRDEARRRRGRRTIFMYSGQGSQYYAMGDELYRHNAAFRQAMQRCAGVYRLLTARDLLAELYDKAKRHDDMDDILLSHPALFAVGYALTQALLDGGVRPDGVLGFSLGEYVAATVAGVLPLDDAMALVVKQAGLVREHAPGGGMLTVLAPVHHIERQPDVYAGTTLASVNFAGNFVVSGIRQRLVALKARLDDLSITSMLLPVAHAFHSPAVDPIEPAFRQLTAGIVLRPPQLPLYSATCGAELSHCDVAHLWNVVRGRTDFCRLVDSVIEGGECCFVDLGPSGTLAAFIKHGYGGRVAHAVAINSFGKNVHTLSQLFATLAA